LKYKYNYTTELTNKTRHKTDTRIFETNVSLKINKSLTNCLLCHICPWNTCTSTVTYLLQNRHWLCMVSIEFHVNLHI